MKLILGALLIFMVSSFNRVKADDDDIEQLISSIFKHPDRKIMTSTYEGNPDHLRSRSKRQSERDLRSCKICGMENFKKQIRTSIIHGDNVEPPFRYPWMVSIQKYITKGKKEFVGDCTGVIISEYYILTAAHCVLKNYEAMEYIEPEDVVVEFLTSTYDVEEGPPVEKVIPHLEYKRYVKHDIALLKLKEKIACDKFKIPICLPPRNIKLPNDTLVTSSGWGLTIAGDQSSAANELKQAKFKIENIDACPVPNGLQKEMHYCLKGMNKQVTCNGDSGGPAFYKEENKCYLLGVLSSGTCNSDKPFMFFSSVPYHLNWIRDHTKSPSEGKGGTLP